jgi:hypothetical protein
MEMEGIMATYKEVYKNLQKRTNQWKIIFFFEFSLIFPFLLHCTLFDEYDYLHMGTLASFQ